MKKLLLFIGFVSTAYSQQVHIPVQESKQEFPPELDTAFIKTILTLNSVTPDSVVVNYEFFKSLPEINKTAWSYLNEKVKNDSGEYATRYQNWLLERLTTTDYDTLNHYILDTLATLKTSPQKSKDMRLLMPLTELLLSLNKLDPNLTNGSHGPNILQLAARAELTHLVDMLLNSKIFSPSASLFWWAINNNYDDIVKALLQQHANPNLTGQKTFTPLLRASYNNNLKMVQLLLAHGANPNSAITEEGRVQGFTALIFACGNGNLDIIAELINNHANVNAQDDAGRTALMIAAQAGKIDVAEYLLKHSAKIDIKNGGGETALAIACLENNFPMAELLLRYKANINARDQDGNTPLFWASARGDIDMVKLLIKHGADITIKNKHRQSILQAAQNREIEMILKAAMPKNEPSHYKSRYAESEGSSSEEE